MLAGLLVAAAVPARRRAQLLLVDEPTSSLDPAATRTVEDAITSLQGRTVLVVSHDRAQLARLCPDVVDLGRAIDERPEATGPCRRTEALPALTDDRRVDTEDT